MNQNRPCVTCGAGSTTLFRAPALLMGLCLLMTGSQIGWTGQPNQKQKSAETTTAPDAGNPKATEDGQNADRPAFDDAQPPPALGVMVEDNGNADDGVEVVDVHPGSPAGRAGIRRGDHIVSVDGKKVSAPHDLLDLIRQQRKVESKAKIGIRRNDEHKVLDVALVAALPRAKGRGTGNGQGNEHGWLGIVLQEQQAGAPAVNGVQIAQVYPKGPAEKAGLKPGDVIASINQQNVRTAQDLVGVVGQLQAKTPVDVVVVRNGTKTPIKVILGGREDFEDLAPDANEPDFAQTFRDPLLDQSLLERHMSEQHHRMETMLQQLLTEVQSLRQEVAALRGKSAAGTSPAKKEAATNGTEN